MSQHGPSDAGIAEVSHRPHGLALALALIAATFVCAAVVALLVPGSQLVLGPIRVSLGDGSRVAFQAALVSALAAAVWPRGRWKSGLCTVSVAAVLVSATADSFPRQVGDGAEYMAMSMALAQFDGATVTADRRAAIEKRLAAVEGWKHIDVALADSAPTSSGRIVFPHFWLYSAVVAPFLYATDTLRVNPNYAFTSVNLLLLVGLCVCLCLGGRHELAVVLCAGPIVWWVDKAHAEVFLFVGLAAMAMLAESKPVAAMSVAAAVVAQNVAAAGALVVPAVALLNEARRRPMRLAAGASVASLVLINPAFYLWVRGIATPLLGDGLSMPSVKALLAPLIDTNLGAIVYAPAYAAAVLVGARCERLRWRVYTWMAGTALLLFAFAQTHNVNHGATPGMSRYGLWMIALAAPLAGTFIRESRPLVGQAIVAITLATTWVAFRPALGEQSGPNWLAARLWNNYPSLDDPLPEIFAERMNRTDGTPFVPVATASCSKVLSRGDGHAAVFPFPCSPSAAPQECATLNTLCYVNDGTFARAPDQDGFGWDDASERSWTVASQALFGDLLKALGRNAALVPMSATRRIVDGENIRRLSIVEGESGAVAWVYPQNGKDATLSLSLAAPARVVVTDRSGATAFASATYPAGSTTIPLLRDTPARILVVDEGGAR